MDPISIATSLVGAQAARTGQQIGVAVLRQSAAAERAVVAMVAGSTSQAAPGPGLGKNLDVTV